VFDLGAFVEFLHVFVALETKFPVWLQEKFFDIRPMRIVARQALAIAHRLVDGFALFVRDIVAIGTQHVRFLL
jgi:hypothetical protein